MCSAAGLRACRGFAAYLEWMKRCRGAEVVWRLVLRRCADHCRNRRRMQGWMSVGGQRGEPRTG